MVELKNKALCELLGALKPEEFNLKIPDYQRIYCWEEKQVLRLLHDVLHYTNKPYHMGTIILHKRKVIKNEKEWTHHDIVDGQQRLVTLALLLLELDYKQLDFVNEIFHSEEARQYVAYNKWLIQDFITRKKKTISAANILEQLQFSVLILPNVANLDLAYTFFSTNNSRGKTLSDYDLLKSHHLRFVHIAEQAKHVATRWDNIIRQSDNENQDNALARTFEINLFRLRQWMRKRAWDNNADRKLKNHFEAAPIIPEIPPFGEQFHFYETIQGGSHFFAYAEYFIQQYKIFQQTPPYIELHQCLKWEKHWWYRDVIEALLFAYFLKFGTQYLCDAFMLITKYVADQRYKTSRAYLNSIFKHVNEGEIVMMINQATSPTFFLAEIRAVTDKLEIPKELSGTRKRFQNHLNSIKENIAHLLVLNNDEHVKA